MAATYVQESFQLKYVFMYLSAQNKLYSKSTSVLSKDSTKADIIIKKPADSFFFFLSLSLSLSLNTHTNTNTDTQTEND